MFLEYKSITLYPWNLVNLTYRQHVIALKRPRCGKRMWEKSRPRFFPLIPPIQYFAFIVVNFSLIMFSSCLWPFAYTIQLV